MNSPHNYQPLVDEAVACWMDAEENRFEFCVKANEVVGKYEEGATVELARQIERSISTVQNYARVGKMWNKMNSQKAEIYRDEIKYSFWALLAPLWDNKVIDMQGVYHWLDEKKENKWTVENMRAKLPTIDGKSVWKKSAKQFLRMTQRMIDAELLNSPALDVDPEDYIKIVRALKLANGRIKQGLGETK